MSVIHPDEENFNYTVRSQKSDSSSYNLAEEKKLIAEATEEIKKELLTKWRKHYANAEIFPKKLSGVHPEVVNFMLAFKNVLFYNKVAKDFGLNQAQRDTLPQVVWEIVSKKAWQGSSRILTDDLKLDSQKVKALGDVLFENIFNEAMKIWDKPVVQRERVNATEEGRKTISLSLLQALKQYPQLGEQVITSNRIKNKVFPDPVRPSIKNWTNDYYENLGAEKHGSIERGNYLFHSENTKGLTTGERQKLGTVLKSLDENTLLTVDQEKQVIIFELSGDELQSAEQSSLRGRQDTNSGFSFSSPQRLSSERQNQPQQAFPRPAAPAPMSQDADPKIKGNVVDLRS